MKARKYIITGLLAGGLLTGGAAGIAMARPAGDCDMGPRGEWMSHEHGHMRGGQFTRMVRHLDLTEAQQAQIRQIAEEARTAGKDARDALRENRQALHDLAAGTDYDAGRVRELADAQAKLQADLLVARTETMHRIHQVLTPEQQAQWARLRDERRGKRDGAEPR